MYVCEAKAHIIFGKLTRLPNIDFYNGFFFGRFNEPAKIDLLQK
jgi:hypothetical protein